MQSRCYFAAGDTDPSAGPTKSLTASLTAIGPALGVSERTPMTEPTATRVQDGTHRHDLHRPDRT
jgi:hypothetical protein